MGDLGKCELVGLIPRARLCPSLGTVIFRYTVLIVPNRSTMTRTERMNESVGLISVHCPASSSRKPALGLCVIFHVFYK